MELVGQAAACATESGRKRCGLSRLAGDAAAWLKALHRERLDWARSVLAGNHLRNDFSGKRPRDNARAKTASGVDIALQVRNRPENGQLVRRAGTQAGPGPLDAHLLEARNNPDSPGAERADRC